MEGVAETSVASAQDAGGQSEAGSRRAEAGASIRAAGFCVAGGGSGGFFDRPCPVIRAG